MFADPFSPPNFKDISPSFPGLPPELERTVSCEPKTVVAMHVLNPAAFFLLLYLDYSPVMFSPPSWLEE